MGLVLASWAAMSARRVELVDHIHASRSVPISARAGSAVFFASDDAKLVSGQVLCVDGGSCMPA